MSEQSTPEQAPTVQAAAEQDPKPSSKECIGYTEFTGQLFHGRAEIKSEAPEVPEDPDAPDAPEVPEGHEAPQQQFDITMNYNYRDHFLAQPISSSISRQLGDGSLTLGPAIYTTTDIEEAVKYARLRAAGSENPVLHIIDVENMPLFDFRTKDGTSNGRIPLDVAQRWNTYYLQHVHRIKEYFASKGEKAMNNYLQRIEPELDSYTRFLNEFIERLTKGEEYVAPQKDLSLRLGGKTDEETTYDKKRDLSLRDMLRTLPGDPQWIDPTYGGLWAGFVEDELHCAGVICIEGGDAPDFKESRTVALYNLNSFVKGQRATTISASGVSL